MHQFMRIASTILMLNSGWKSNCVCRLYFFMGIKIIISCFFVILHREKINGMNRILLVLLFIFSSTLACQTKAGGYQEQDYSHHSVSLTGGITFDDTWKVEFSYRFSPFKYVGFGAGVGYWRQYGNDNVPHEYMVWAVNDESKNIGDFYLRPNVMVYTPDFFHIKDCAFSLFVNPGAILNIPYGNANLDLIDATGVVTGSDNVHNSHGKWAAFDLTFGLRFGTEDAHFFLGYEFSTMDIYGMYRPMVYRGVKFNNFYPSRKRQNGLTFEISLEL